MLERFFTPRITELGKIKVGGLGQERTSAKGSTYRQPVKFDHFVVVTMNRNKAGDLEPDTELMAQLVPEYGSEDGLLRQLPIQVLSNDIEDVMQSAYVWYWGKTCGGRSDGATVTWSNDPTNGRRLDAPRSEPWADSMLDMKDSKGNKLFKLHSVFNCVIAAKEARFGGVYKFRTTSIISGRQLYSSLIELQARTFGVLIGLPLRLVVRPLQVAPDGKPTTVYVVHVELHGQSLAAIQAQALDQMKVFAANRDQMQVVQAQYKRLLLPPGMETAETDMADINEEWQPETAQVEPKPPATADPLLAATQASQDSTADLDAFAPAQPTQQKGPSLMDQATMIDEIQAALEDADLSEAVEGAMGTLGLNEETWMQADDAVLDKLLGKVRDIAAAKA
jgi:hypothetical protein